jgi:hypothetical protein
VHPACSAGRIDSLTGHLHAVDCDGERRWLVGVGVKRRWLVGDGGERGGGGKSGWGRGVSIRLSEARCPVSQGQQPPSPTKR